MSDRTRCAKCGGQFSAKRIHIDGKQYHPECAIGGEMNMTIEQGVFAEGLAFRDGLQQGRNEAQSEIARLRAENAAAFSANTAFTILTERLSAEKDALLDLLRLILSGIERGKIEDANILRRDKVEVLSEKIRAAIKAAEEGK